LLIFLGLYNVGHIGLRVWGLRVGWRHGMRVAAALANPVLRQGPTHIARAAALLAGIAIPLALERILEPGRALLGGVLLTAVAGATLLARLHGRVEGWRLALGVLAAFALYSMVAQ
jgi:PTS system mannose-specific IID component